jgi:sugar lactone lactonase YvrE
MAGGLARRTRWLIGFVALLCMFSAVPVLASSAPEQPPPVTLPEADELAEPPRLPTSQDLAQTFAQFEAEEAEQQKELESPAAVSMREDSRTAYANLPPAEAEQLLSATFGDQLKSLNAEPARFLSDATLDRPLGNGDATVIDEGHHQILDGNIPVEAKDDEGELRKVDLTLEETEEGWEPVNPLVDVAISESAEEGVEVGNEGLAISLANAEEGAAQPLGSKNIFFGEVEEGSDSDLLVSPIAGGVELFDQLRSEESPETLRFHLQLPPGAELQSAAGGAKVASSDDATLAEVPPPTAIDAQGTEVPVIMTVEGNALVLQVEHRDAEFAYPILVDPALQDYYWHNWYNNENLPALSNGAWQWNSNVSWVYGSTSCIYTCWGGSHRGLYISTPSGYLPPNGWGQWYYSTPNSETYLANAWISPFWRDNHTNCPQWKYGQPYDYDGMWNETSWNRVLTNQANDQGWSDIESWGRAFIIGVGTSSGVSIPCWRDNMAGGVAIWLEDWSQPNLTTSSTYKWMDGSPVRLNVSANDSGLGVQKFETKATNSSGQQETWWTNSSCTGLYEAPCPHSWNLGESSQPMLSYNPAVLPEGIDKLQITAFDAAGKPSFYMNEVEIEVDHAAPAITLSGTLTEQAKLGTELPSYAVRADATDGVAGSNNPADARSGVTSITFETDGKLVSSYNPGCPSQSCSWYREIEVPASELSVGSHTLRVKATDALGHVGTKELSFTVGDTKAPTLSVSGLPAESAGPLYATYWSSFGAVGAGNGQLSHPADIALDASGNLWVVDENNNRVEKFNESGTYLSQFGSKGAGNGQFTRPTSLAIDSKGNIWVLDAGNHRVQKFNEKGQFLMAFGAAGAGNGQLSTAEGIAIDSKGNIWIADTYNARIEEFNEKGEFVRTVGTSGSGTGQLTEPTGIDIGTGNKVWVADWANNKVVVYTETGEFVRQFGSSGSGNGQFAQPDALTIDGKGDVWVGEEGNSRIQEFNQNGEYLMKFGSAGSGAGQFSFGYPMGIASDATGELWISDSNNNRVQRWLTPYSTVSAFLKSISASATDAGGFGVTSVALKLTNAAKQTEVLAQNTQSCPKGTCSLSASFEGPELSEKAAGTYILTVSATDAAGNTKNTSRAINIDPGPPSITLSGTLAERAGLTLNAPSGELSIKATDTNLSGSGVKTINIERDDLRVASFASNCTSACPEATASFRYSARRDGTERTVQTAAEPSGATMTRLNDVSCLSTSNCRAVGYYRNSAGTIVPLAERWDGTTWQVQAAPVPAGALESQLESISCDSASSCFAVGFYKTASEAFSTLTERWNGTEWAIVSSPNAGGVPKSYLYGVSCPSASNCWAVGRSTYKAQEEFEGKKPIALLERWDGSEWSISAISEPPTQLKEISCPTTSFCLAVTSQEGLALQRWNGSAWAPQTVASPGSTATLKDVSCVAETACTLVGKAGTAPLAERWNGSQWVVQTTPNPVTVSEAFQGTLEGVSCPTASACTAVGSYLNRYFEFLPMVESWDGTEWALQYAPSHSSTEANTEAVSCAAEFECELVGHYANSGTKALAEQEAPSVDSHLVTVEAVDKFGNAESKSIAVDVPEEEGETPACSKKVTTVTAQNVITSTQATSAVEGSLPTAVAASKSTTLEATEEKIDPSYSSPNPNLESVGTPAEGETSVTPQGGFTLDGIACITPAKTTTAATEAKVVNGDAAVFANTAPQTDTVIRPTSGGATVVQSLRGPNAPSSFSWNVTVNPGEKLVKLASGAIAVTRELPAGEESGEIAQLAEPGKIHSPEALNSAAVQLEVGEYRLAKAEAETSEEVVAVIPTPWVVLAQGGIVPAQIELKVTEVPTEYNVVFVPPPFESNMPSESAPAELMGEATISAVVNGRCLEGSPCGTFDASRAANYAEYFGSPKHSRNPYYHDYGSNNCTNFVSQVIARGGMSYMRAFDHGDGSWWYKNTGRSLPWPPYEDTESWRLADNLPRHLWQYGLAYIDSVNEPWGWTQGDILAEDWYGTNGKGDFNHVQFVVGTTGSGNNREPLIANESQPESANYSHKPWAEVKKRIEGDHEHEWNRVPLAVKHTVANLDAKHHDPDNLYTANGVFSG